jgi:hypothetical protein
MRGWSSYLEWREGLHKSAARDTSLLQMLPDWLPKDVSMLLRLTIQVHFHVLCFALVLFQFLQ